MRNKAMFKNYKIEKICKEIDRYLYDKFFIFAPPSCDVDVSESNPKKRVEI